MKNVFVLVRFELVDNAVQDVDVVGVFSTPEKGKEAFTSLKKGFKNKDIQVYYVLEEHTLDQFEDDTETALEELCKSGYVEPLVGEDGEFSFRLTDKGKERAEKLYGGDKESTDEQE